MLSKGITFLHSNDKQFGFINGIIYHLIGISDFSMVSLKCSMLQEQIKIFFKVKN